MFAKIWLFKNLCLCHVTMYIMYKVDFLLQWSFSEFEKFTLYTVMPMIGIRVALFHGCKWDRGQPLFNAR